MLAVSRVATLSLFVLVLLGTSASGEAAEAPIPSIHQARRLLDKGDHAAAVPMLKSLTEEKGKAAGEACLLLGNYYKSVAEDVRSAIAAYRTGVQKLGDSRGKVHFDTQTALASALVVAEDADEALEILQSLTKEYGGPTPEWSYWTARCYILKGHKERAHELFRQVISEHSRNPIALNASLNLARSLFSYGRKAEGLSVLDDYVAGHPHAETQMNTWKGDILFENGHYAEAIPLLQATAQNPRYSANSEVVKDLVVALCRVGRTREGMEMAKLVPVNETGDRLAGAYNWLGNTYLHEAENCREAVKAHKSALHVKGISPDSRGYTLFRLVVAYKSCGDSGRARAVLVRLAAEQGAESTWAKRADEWLAESPPAK